MLASMRGVLAMLLVRRSNAIVRRALSVGITAGTALVMSARGRRAVGLVAAV